MPLLSHTVLNHSGESTLKHSIHKHVERKFCKIYFVLLVQALIPRPGIRIKLEDCVARGNSEVDCLRPVFNDDYFWD